MHKLLLIVFIFPLLLRGQQRKIDSLINLLKTDKEDSLKVKHLNRLTLLNKSLGNYDTALYFGYSAKALAEKINFKKGLARAYNEIANVYDLKGDYKKALDYNFKSLAINKELGDKDLIAKCLGNIGIIYMYQSDFTKSLEYFLKSLKIKEELNNKPEIAITTGNIGLIYYQTGEYDKALSQFLKAMQMEEALGHKENIGSWLSNIGLVYIAKKNYPEAIETYLKALKIANELGNKQLLGNIYANMGGIYEMLGNFDETIAYELKALKIAEELGNKNVISSIMANIGALYTQQKKYKESFIYLYRSLQMEYELGTMSDVIKTYEHLSKLYELTSLPLLDTIGGKTLNIEQTRLRSLYYYKRFIEIRDTLFNEESRKQLIQKELNYEFEKKEIAAKALQEKKDLFVAEEKQKQVIIIIAISGILILVIVFSVFLFNRFKVTQKQKRLIEIKEQETQLQKHIIEEKHKEITDSINYAERIQRSFLATKEHLNANLKDYFVLFKPKDIVSGDFYWSSILNNGNFILATADSTGHGVPGAIMSLLNITSLEKAIENCEDPAEILNSTRKTIIERLKKDGSEQGGKDGMDVSLCVYDFKNKKLIISAANNPVWIVRNKPATEVLEVASATPITIGAASVEVIEIKPDKMPVGKHDKDNISFTRHNVDLQKGDVIYTLTDGFPDQFGGEKGKKYMSKNLRELLVANSHLPMQEQKQLLEKTFAEWVGQLEQVDDVTVIGVRV